MPQGLFHPAQFGLTVETEMQPPCWNLAKPVPSMQLVLGTDGHMAEIAHFAETDTCPVLSICGAARCQGPQPNPQAEMSAAIGSL